MELTKKEIIFAQNGSGKTNLSRLIDAISEKTEITEFLSQEAER
jgi:ABC-type molybdenum transport system ATPase subunit/photorepair protein PhrA